MVVIKSKISIFVLNELHWKNLAFMIQERDTTFEHSSNNNQEYSPINTTSCFLKRDQHDSSVAGRKKKLSLVATKLCSK